MQNIIAVTTIKEKEDMMCKMYDNLKALYLTDVSISIHRHVSRIDVMQQVNGMQHKAASYIVVVLPMSISLDGLKGFAHGTNINISHVLNRLDSIKAELIFLVNSRKNLARKAANKGNELKIALDRIFR